MHSENGGVFRTDRTGKVAAFRAKNLKKVCVCVWGGGGGGWRVVRHIHVLP